MRIPDLILPISLLVESSLHRFAVPLPRAFARGRKALAYMQ
jgi:hypothetical protein